MNGCGRVVAEEKNRYREAAVLLDPDLLAAIAEAKLERENDNVKQFVCGDKYPLVVLFLAPVRVIQYPAAGAVPLRHRVSTLILLKLLAKAPVEPFSFSPP